MGQRVTRVKADALTFSSDGSGAASAACLRHVQTLGIGGAPGGRYKRAPIAGGSAYPSPRGHQPWQKLPRASANRKYSAVPSQEKPYQASQVLSSLSSWNGAWSLPETAFDRCGILVYVSFVHPGNASAVHASGVLSFQNSYSYQAP